MKKHFVFLMLQLFTFLFLFLPGCSAVPETPAEALNEPAYQAMRRVRADVLSVQLLSAEEALAMFPELSDSLQKDVTFVTNITVGFRVENSSDAQLIDLSNVWFSKNRGKELSGICKHYIWQNEDGCWAIERLFITGDIDPADLNYTLHSAGGEISYQNTLPESISSFDAYENIKIPESSLPLIFALNGQHFIQLEQSVSDPTIEESEDGFLLCDSKNYVFVPLDGNLSFSLKMANLQYDIQPEEKLPENITLSAYYSRGENASSRLCLMVETFIESEIYTSGNFNESILRQINHEILSSAVLTITDSQGNIVNFSS